MLDRDSVVATIFVLVLAFLLVLFGCVIGYNKAYAHIISNSEVWFEDDQAILSVDGNSYVYLLGDETTLP